jgi:hypothetical protein
VSAPTTKPSDASTQAGGNDATIQLVDYPNSAKPFETVPIRGQYRGGGDTFVQAQRREEGKWIAFPLPTKTDQSGEFTAYVELWQPGRYRLRVVDPRTGLTSQTFVLVVQN